MIKESVATVVHACGLHAHDLARHASYIHNQYVYIIIYSDDNVKTPQEHINFIHQEFLKICKGSGFKGLKYRGGPELKCAKCKKTVIMESVCYENGEGSKEAEKTVRHCPGDNHDINEEVLF